MRDSLKEMETLQDRDPLGNLLDWRGWTESYAEELAPSLGIPGGLTTRHWEVIRSIRKHFAETGKCPVVYQTCRQQGLRLRELEELFPTGYQRGACKLAGVSYKEAYLGADYMEHSAKDLHAVATRQEYRVDVRGFLVDPDEWDEHYAAHRAYEMKIPGGKLGKMHWQIIRFLRSTFYKTGKIPTVTETCEANDIDIDELEQLFPDGYHRGAVKIAGLRLR